MNSRERVAMAIDLKEADHVPVGPFTIWHHAAVAGVKVSDYIWDVDTCFKANHASFKYYNEGFDVMNIAPMLLAYSNINPVLYSALYFDWKFFDDSLPQFHEVQQGGEDIYDKILKKGFSTIRTFERVGFGRFLKNLTVDVVKYLKWMKKVNTEWDVQPFGDMVSYTPAELMMFVRANRGFIDLKKCPEKLIEVNERWSKTFVKKTLQIAKLIKTEFIFMPSLKFSTSFVNPKIFEKIQWPYYKEMAEAYTKAGFKVILHLDGDWGPLLDHFTDLTPKMYVMELDVTDMKLAKKVVGKTMCIKGMVDPMTLARGTVKEIEIECKQFIDDCASGGGFILSSGCEAPPDTKPENIKMMIKCAQEYGKY
jgi:Uroporphyrinogen decarboxylase (URO-D)